MKVQPNLQKSELKCELEKAYHEEKHFWKHKTKNSWLQVGGMNTKVLHGWTNDLPWLLPLLVIVYVLFSLLYVF